MTEEPEGSLVDWGLAASLGRRMAGEGESPLDEAAVRASCEEALSKALAYTTLVPTSPVPPVELVSRDEWINANLAELAKMFSPMEERFAGDLDLPRPLGGIARKVIGATAGAEAGAVVGYASKRVLGQYQVSLRPDPGYPRMLLVGANLGDAAAKLEVDPDAFLLWVSIHEQTHSIQFASVPWLRDHIAGLVSALLDAATGGIDARAIFARAKELVGPDPREGMRRLLGGELSRVFASPEQSAVMDQVQAVMAVVEGYAEHVMDEASAGVSGLTHMRERMTARRAERTGLADLVARILGLGAKLRQYELGKSWCDAVAGEVGVEGLDRVWESPEALPSLEELEDADAWVRRVLTPAAA
ncbi:MAG: zinc-dependent metalloprotease [Actinomycetota bacterium]|nr:zinc-dependent metalloprotease [Actinomycetota bacterium]